MTNQPDNPVEADYRLDNIPSSQIDPGERIREEYHNITALASDISEHGIISPIAVLDKEAAGLGDENTYLDPSKPYLLLAGGRRLLASQEAGLATLPAKIYSREMSEWEMRIIEFHENLKREDMTPFEEAKAEKEIHSLYVGLYGASDRGAHGQKGHSQKDTAKMLGVTPAKISQDFEIAEWGEELDEVRNAETKAQAKRIIKEYKKRIASQEKAKRIKARQKKSDDQGEVVIQGADGDKRSYKKGLADRYLITDYFKGIQELPDRSVDLLELDPDWGIDFLQSRTDRNITQTDDPYREIAPEAYERTLREIVEAALPKMKDHSWLLCWYSIEEWHRETWEILTQCGLKVSKMPAFWIKSTGNTRSPAFKLGHTVAGFYYARKGSPRIQEDEMGRDNTYHFRTPTRSERLHPAEKPVELYESILRTFITQGQNLVTGFAGSGNIMLAAENLQINSVGFEVAKEYKDDFTLKVFNQQHGQYHTYDHSKV